LRNGIIVLADVDEVLEVVAVIFQISDSDRDPGPAAGCEPVRTGPPGAVPSNFR
jgi:hypothetical protein